MSLYRKAWIAVHFILISALIIWLSCCNRSSAHPPIDPHLPNPEEIEEENRNYQEELDPVPWWDDGRGHRYPMSRRQDGMD